jgi:hypothetical protein
MVTTFHGTAIDVRTRDDKGRSSSEVPSLLEWLWRNKTVGLFAAAAISSIGFVLGFIRRLTGHERI